MIYCGVDYSITSPGLTIIDGDSVEYHFRFDLPKRKEIPFAPNMFPKVTCSKIDQMDRYVDNADWIVECINGRDAVVVIEGYAMGKGGSGGRVFDIAENCAILKYKLKENGISYITPTPGQIKKFYTGKGNAKKFHMVEEFQARTGIDLLKMFGRTTYSSPISDIADSHAMALYCQVDNGVAINSERSSLIHNLEATLCANLS